MRDIAWHFVGEKLRDGRPVPADGEWLTYTGNIEWCRTGLYASRKPSQALEFAEDRRTLCVVECEDIEKEEADKFVCRRRRILLRIDTAKIMREYTRLCALSVIHLWGAPKTVVKHLTDGGNGDPRSLERTMRALCRRQRTLNLAGPNDKDSRPSYLLKYIIERDAMSLTTIALSAQREWDEFVDFTGQRAKAYIATELAAQVVGRSCFRDFISPVDDKESERKLPPNSIYYRRWFAYTQGIDRAGQVYRDKFDQMIYQRLGDILAYFKADVLHGITKDLMEYYLVVTRT